MTKGELLLGMPALLLWAVVAPLILLGAAVVWLVQAGDRLTRVMARGRKPDRASGNVQANPQRQARV